jgi:hypothetical protein
MNSGVGTIRRYYLLKSQAAKAAGDESLKRTWWAKQSEVPGTGLPADFPSKAALAALRYTTIEDLKGDEVQASVEELVKAGLPRREAALVIEALPEL